MRSVLDIGIISSGAQKFRSPRGDSTFNIMHGATVFTVDVWGNVISPPNVPLDYILSDVMIGNQSGYSGTVKDFLTVDPFLDSPGSKLW